MKRSVSSRSICTSQCPLRAGSPERTLDIATFLRCLSTQEEVRAATFKAASPISPSVT